MSAVPSIPNHDGFTEAGLPVSLGMQYLLAHPSQIREPWPLIKAKARDGMPVPFDVISHGVGRIPMEVCDTIRNEMILNMSRSGLNPYTAPALGVMELRSAISDEMNQLCEQDLTNPNSVAVVSGGSLGGLTYILGIATNPGDLWMEFVPAWGGLQHEVQFWGRRYRQYLLPTARLPTVEDLLREIPTDCRVVSINDPGNPTGMGLNLKDCQTLNAFALARPNTVVVVDMTYMRLHAGEFLTPFMFNAPNIVCVSGASKGINLAAARLGWVICNSNSGYDELFARRNDQLLSAPNPFGLQYAVAKGLRDRGPGGVWAYCDQIKANVEASRNVVAEELEGHQLIRHRRGTSAIYDCLEMPEGVDAREVSRWGLNERYNGRIDRPYTDTVPAFFTRGRWARFTHAQPDPRPGIINLRQDVEEFVAAGCPTPPTVQELLGKFGPKAA